MSIRANAIKPTEKVGISISADILCDFSNNYKGEGIHTFYYSDVGDIGFIVADKEFLIDFEKEDAEWKDEVNMIIKYMDEQNLDYITLECY